MIKKFLAKIRTNDCSKLSESTKYIIIVLITSAFTGLTVTAWDFIANITPTASIERLILLLCVGVGIAIAYYKSIVRFLSKFLNS